MLYFLEENSNSKIKKVEYLRRRREGRGEKAMRSCKLLKPLVNKIKTRLSIEIKHKGCRAGMREHRNELFRRNPFEEIRFRSIINVITRKIMKQMGKIKISIRAIELSGSLIISHGGFFSSGKRTKPEPRALLGLPYLGHPLAPSALPDAAVLAGGVLRAAFAS